VRPNFQNASTGVGPNFSKASKGLRPNFPNAYTGVGPKSHNTSRAPIKRLPDVKIIDIAMKPCNQKLKLTDFQGY